MDKRNVLVTFVAEDLFFETDILINYLKTQVDFTETITLIEANNYSMTPKKPLIETWLIRYNNYHFFQLFRMEKKTFHTFVSVIHKVDINQILKKIYMGGHYPLSSESQVLVFLWYMAASDSLLSIGDRFNICPATVMSVVNKILYFVGKLKKAYIVFPQNEQQLQDISRGFNRYPGVVGALDGTHVFVKVEKGQQDSYIDRYRRHSINILGICDSNMLFTYVFAGFPGSVHDSRVFQNSLLYRDIETNGPNHLFMDDNIYHLIGDSAFAVQSWLMTPYKGNNLARQEKHHNYCLSSDRVVIEHAFGQLKGRWRRLQFINTYNICKAVEIANCACVLHNFCLLNRDLWVDEYINAEMNANPEIDHDPAGRLKRDRIANELYENTNN